MYFRFLHALFLVFLAGFLGGLAQASELSCDEENPDEVEMLICADDDLLASENALKLVIRHWEKGINADRIDFILSEQEIWKEARKICLEDEDPQGCLKEQVEARIQLLSNPRVFQLDLVNEGREYRQLARMTAFDFDAVQFEKSLLDFEGFEEFVQELRLGLERNHEKCDLCDFERTIMLSKGFDGQNLLIVNVHVLEKMEDSDEVFRHKVFVFDKESGEEVGFMGLFDPSVSPFARTALAEEILGHLDRLNHAVKGNEGGETLYYWPDLQDTMKENDLASWNEMGFYPEKLGKKIAGFRYQADAYEFAPFNSSQYFSDFVIDAEALLGFIKPEYRSDFSDFSDFNAGVTP